MSQAEFERWFDFYQMHPFDDLHRFHRPAALIARSMTGAEIEDMIQWLHPKYKEESEDGEYTEADLKTFKALGLSKPPKRS